MHRQNNGTVADAIARAASRQWSPGQLSDLYKRLLARLPEIPLPDFDPSNLNWVAAWSPAGQVHVHSRVPLVMVSPAFEAPTREVFGAYAEVLPLLKDNSQEDGPVFPVPPRVQKLFPEWERLRTLDSNWMTAQQFIEQTL